MRRIHLFAALALGGLLPLLAACNQAPAREALAESEQAIASARPQLEQFAPEELAALQASAAEARAYLEAGRYTDSLAIGLTLPGRVEDALQKAEGRKGSEVAEWTTLAGRVPLILDGADVRARDLAAAKALPRTLAPETFAAVQAELAATRRAWTEAKAVFEAGRVTRAVAAAREVQARVEAAAAQIGLTPAAAMAAASLGSSGSVPVATIPPKPALPPPAPPPAPQQQP
jgi:hypothetical protein